jgi:lipopolysaccharide/colanic/teichoic acid biosynthesis glycosyltransferase
LRLDLCDAVPLGFHWREPSVTGQRDSEDIAPIGQPAGASPEKHRAAVPVWKRMLDLSCLLIVVPSVLPLMVMIAILIKSSSKGPVLFRQERVGLFGRRFTLFKFRTMTIGADRTVHEQYVANMIEANAPMTKLDAVDKRLIPVGRLLRAASLDELPQLINVAKGEMSLVGPRPCLPSEYFRFLPWQKERFHTLPGLTGLWQVSGKNRTTFNEMIEMDIKYKRTKSLWLDLKIMLMTIPVVMVEVKDARVRIAPAVNPTSKNPSSSSNPSASS